MADYDERIADAQKKLTVVNNKIAEVERMKALEAGLRAEASALSIQIDEWKSEKAYFAEQAKQEEERAAAAKKAKEAKEAEERAAAEAKKRAAAAPAPAPAPAKEEVPKTPEEAKEEERKKRIKALTKKLQQIEKLKQKDPSELDPEAKEKVASEGRLLKEVACLERGEEYVPEPDPVPEPAKQAEQEQAEEEQAPSGKNAAGVVKLPTEPAEVEKMKKQLRKKLKQIEDLKLKDNLDPEAAAKVASEEKLSQELAALERGDSEFVYQKQDEQTNGADAKSKSTKKK
eukprot:gnl/TRDRNA2_/TRDRNA2_40873_c0_seq1.p1 gnl/TRDRNA2_/TRDRNA2_40873_c0~~gnl/TRDRNA2_/TRDRNA2_40873_c0_seq1.p1  ORF type:complete len:310 (-),score=135.28 gnl/TRDRNA2_/TRDRNA2_40873_c0_seq1:109-969(-)